MGILLTKEIEKQLVTSLIECKHDVNIITAFCKLGTLERIDKSISPEVRKRILVRFLPSDIASGATDSAIFDYCKKHSWELFVDFTMHAKTYVFDHQKCIIGSANLTNKGLGLAEYANTETATLITLNDEDYQKVLSLYDMALKMDEDLYCQIMQEQDDKRIGEIISRRCLHFENVTCLMPEDFPTEKDDLLDMRHLKSYQWLFNYLKNKEEHFAFFGELTKHIHDIFVQDPRPYRKDIKEHLSNLLTAICKNHDPYFRVSVPSYSQKIELIMQE